jgi:phospholipase D1/2
VDAASYFDAFRRAAERAERSILILAWDFDSRTPLAWDDSHATLRLGDFLNSLAHRRRGLEVRVLDWDYPLLYGFDREAPPIFGLGWKPHRRVHVRYDGTHPFVASQHQKIVAIDDRLAFVGGLDLASRRWDTSAHAPRDPRRLWLGEPYPPFHDVMAMLDGDAARELADVARRRWRRATGERLAPVEARTDPWPPGTRPDLEHVRVGIACTAPETEAETGAREVERLYVDMIERARQYVYMENQYFTSSRIGQALAGRLASAEGPEVVVVTRLLSHGWLEEHTMHVLRARLVDELRAADRHGRFHVLYPHVPGLAEGTCVDLHSKVAIVDDEWLRIGSANLSNRSMGLDTECDVIVEAEGRAATRAVIRTVRDRLLAEHLDVAPSDVAEQVRRTGSIAGAVAALRSEGRTLDVLGGGPALPAEVEDAVAAAADPERPVSLDALLEQFGPDVEPAARRVPRLLLVAGGVVVALALAYWLSPFREMAHASEAARLVQDVAGRWWLAPLLLLAYTPGSFILFPRQVITISAALAFGPALAGLLALVGNLVAASVGYAAGRRCPRDTVRRLVGAKLNRLSQLLREQGLFTLSALRLVPLGPFAAQNVVAGAIRVPFARFLAATLIGILPGTIVTTLFGGQVRHVLLHGGRLDTALVASLVVWLGVCGVVARWILFRRRFRPLLAAASRATDASGPPGTAGSGRDPQPGRPAVGAEGADSA